MITITTSGSGPITPSLTTEKQLLIAAWAYGLKVGHHIHRFSLFAFVQSHLANKTEENLQRTLEADIQNWRGIGSGFYSLTENGYQQLSKHDPLNITIPIGSIFTFSKIIDHYTISVTVDPTKRRYIAKQNGDIVNPEFIIENIVDITKDTIATSQTSLPRQILNWILNDNKYQWIIENFMLPKAEIYVSFSEETEDEKEQAEIIQSIKQSNKSKQSLIDELSNLKNTEPEEVIINGKAFKRDNKTIAQIKILRDFKCQICGTSIRKKDGSNYIEAAHIKAKHQKGGETPDNIILLCPNHHKEFDFGERIILSHDSNKIILKLNGHQYEISLLIQ